MYHEIKLSCAECLFSLACQRPLSKTDTLQLIGHLKDDSSLAADGTLSPVTLNLLMALLYCFDVSIVEREDSDGEPELFACWQRVCHVPVIFAYRLDPDQAQQKIRPDLDLSCLTF